MTATETQLTIENATPGKQESGPIKVKDGIYENVDDPDYRRWADPAGEMRMSKSTLEHANPGDDQQDMAKLQMAHAGKLAKTDTDALSFGRAFDTRLLDPPLYRELFSTMPNFGDLRKKENKARRDEWSEKNSGKSFISRDDGELIDRMVNAVHNHKVVRLIRESGGVQTSLAWTDEKWGVPMRARLDKRVSFKGSIWIIDVKTVRDCSDRTIKQQTTGFGYHRQNAIYADGHEALTGQTPMFLFVFVSKEDNPVVRTEVLDPAYVDLGRCEYRHTLGQWVRARKTGVYNPPYTDIHELEAPKWVTQRIETYGGMN